MILFWSENTRMEILGRIREAKNERIAGKLNDDFIYPVPSVRPLLRTFGLAGHVPAKTRGGNGFGKWRIIRAK